MSNPAIDYYRNVSGSNLIVSTTFALEGFEIVEYKGVVRGITVRAPTISQGIIGGLKSMGFDTMLTETAIVPVLCGDDERAFAMTREAQHNDVFVLPVVSPAVPEGLARLRATVTAAHEPSEIERGSLSRLAFSTCSKGEWMMR